MSHLTRQLLLDTADYIEGGRGFFMCCSINELLHTAGMSPERTELTFYLLRDGIPLGGSWLENASWPIARAARVNWLRNLANELFPSEKESENE